VIRFDAANPPVDVDSRCAPAHNLHKPSNHNKQKRTIDVLPNPDNLISYRQALPAGAPGRRPRQAPPTGAPDGHARRDCLMSLAGALFALRFV
jgi:hypothetical protein